MFTFREKRWSFCLHSVISTSLLVMEHKDATCVFGKDGELQQGHNEFTKWLSHSMYTNMCVCVHKRLTSPWREWSVQHRLEGGSSTLKGLGTGVYEHLEDTHTHIRWGHHSGLLALLAAWEPGIKQKDAVTILFSSCHTVKQQAWSTFTQGLYSGM